VYRKAGEKTTGKAAFDYFFWDAKCAQMSIDEDGGMREKQNLCGGKTDSPPPSKEARKNRGRDGRSGEKIVIGGKEGKKKPSRKPL